MTSIIRISNIVLYRVIGTATALNNIDNRPPLLLNNNFNRLKETSSLLIGYNLLDKKSRI